MANIITDITNNNYYADVEAFKNVWHFPNDSFSYLIDQLPTFYKHCYECIDLRMLICCLFYIILSSCFWAEKMTQS